MAAAEGNQRVWPRLSRRAGRERAPMIPGEVESISSESSQLNRSQRTQSRSLTPTKRTSEGPQRGVSPKRQQTPPLEEDEWRRVADGMGDHGQFNKNVCNFVESTSVSGGTFAKMQWCPERPTECCPCDGAVSEGHAVRGVYFCLKHSMKLIEAHERRPKKLLLGIPTREVEAIKNRGAEAVTRAQAAADEKRKSDETVQNTRKVADELAKEMLAVEAERERLLAIASLAAREKADLQNRLQELERQAKEVVRGGQQEVANVHQEAQALDQRRAAVFKEEQSEMYARPQSRARKDRC